MNEKPNVPSLILHATSLTKKYYLGKTEVPVLDNACVSINKSEWVAILGSSGSGKSTLLHLLGGLDTPSEPNGSIFFEGTDICKLNSKELDRYRREQIGFVFQFYHLLPELTVLENVLLPSEIISQSSKEKINRGKDLLQKFGLASRLKHRPRELSGGERQRVAIARALINSPKLLLADEPTGNLDKQSGLAIMELLSEEYKTGLTIITVTHDRQIAKYANKVITLTEGRTTENISRTASSAV